MFNLNESVVRVSGRIDVAASLEALESALEAAIVAEETATQGVSAAVLGVFADHKGAAINKPAVASLAMQKLGTSPAEYGATKLLIDAYIDQNKGEGGLFKVTKGKGGGVTLRADAAPAAE
jgi:hypothetical protein